MQQTETRLKEMKRQDLQHARLVALALRSISEDLAPLVNGSELSEDPLDAGVWLTEHEQQSSEAINEQLAQLRQTLEQLGLRALVFIASEDYLSKPQEQ
jgi:hypothetical protein